jgi:hypothetical protein
MPVNAQGEETAGAENPEIAKLRNDAAALTNLLTVLVKRSGSQKGDGVTTEASVTPAELSALNDKLEVITDRSTGNVLVRITSRGKAPLTDEQLRNNAMASEIALPKKGIITPPSGLILP